MENIAIQFQVSPINNLINNITVKYLQGNWIKDGGRSSGYFVTLELAMGKAVRYLWNGKNKWGVVV